MSTNGDRIVNALTIDVEDYFHTNAMDGVIRPEQWDALPQRVERNTTHLLDLLNEFDVHATFFVLGWVAERWPRLVREIARRGHDVASHGYAHRLTYRLGREGFRTDIARGKHVLEDCLGARVVGFRAASYSIVATTLWALDILVEEGFEYDSSIFPVHHDLYGVPGFSRLPVRVRCQAGDILEIPPSTVRLFRRNWPVAGGGYLRLFPYWVTERCVSHINRHDGVPAIVYVHPWEVDIDQPRLPGRTSARFRQYLNLHRTEPRLRRLLRRFRFGRIRDAVEFIDAPVVTVTSALSGGV